MRTKKKTLLALLCMLMLMTFLPLQTFAASKKSSIKLNKTTLTITAGNTATLKATVTGKNKKVTWSSSKTSVATVKDGKIKAKKAGKVTITAKANGKTAKCQVTVKAVNYKKIYREFLENSQITANGEKITPKYFYLLNIDKSGVPELIVTPDPWSYCDYHVYTIKKNKVTYMGYCTAKGVMGTPTLYYSSKYKAILVEGWTNAVGGSWSAYYGISGSKFVKKQHCLAWTNPKEYATGQTGGKETVVSKSKYESFFKKYFTNGKIKQYTMKENTAANRNDM